MTTIKLPDNGHTESGKIAKQRPTDRKPKAQDDNVSGGFNQKSRPTTDGRKVTASGAEE